MGGYKQFGFGRDDENIGKKSKRFQGETGHTYLISYVWWPGLENGVLDMDADTPEFRGVERHWMDGVGYVINDGPEYTKIAGSAPRQAIATIIIVWPTDRHGTFDKDRFKAGDYKVVPWVFASDKYKHMGQIHSEWPFGQHDVKAECTEAKFQRFQFSPCRDNFLRKLIDKGEPAKEIVDRILGEAQEIMAGIGNELGQEMTIQQINEKLAGKGPGGPGGGGGGGGRAPSGGGAVTADVDSVVDDILDD